MLQPIGKTGDAHSCRFGQQGYPSWEERKAIHSTVKTHYHCFKATCQKAKFHINHLRNAPILTKWLTLGKQEQKINKAFSPDARDPDYCSVSLEIWSKKVHHSPAASKTSWLHLDKDGQIACMSLTEVLELWALRPLLTVHPLRVSGCCL